MKTRLFKLLILLLIISLPVIGSSNSLYIDSSSITGITFTTTCWGVPDTPDRIAPTYSITSDLNINFIWSPSTNHCPNPEIYYNFQIAKNIDFTVDLQQSGWTTNASYPILNIPEGEYWWRVRAKDNYGNSSAFSFPWKLTVDRTKPQSVITSPSNGGSNSTVFSNLWDGNVSGNASDNSSGIAHVDVSIHRASDDTYWNGSNWVSGSESSTRVTAIGTTNWIYFVSDHSTATTYTFTSHAIDNAGNVENSYKLILIINPPSPKITFNLSDDKKTMSFTLSSIENFAKLNYELTYETDSEPQGILGEVELNNQSEFKKENIILGTCSAGGTCVYHQGVKNINLKIDLLDKDNKITTLSSSL